MATPTTSATAMDAGLRDDLIVLSRAINADPELAYEERRAVQRIEALLGKYGHAMERGLGGLETAFRARVGPPGRAVALLAEYDALPDVGHGCGHNLIAMTNVGAFLLAARRAERLAVGIELIGTPAEERGGGKIDLLDAGAFRDVVAALSTHPGDKNWNVGGTSLGVVVKRIGFHGLASHAAVSPERGRNALNGVIRLFTGVDGWRQHLPDDARVHGIITNGGAAQNIVPSYAEALFGLRSKDLAVLEDMIATFAKIAEGAALQTGTTVEITDEMRLYRPMRPDAKVGDVLVAELEARGVTVDRGGIVPASTDLGNVSQAVPTDYISFPVSESKIAGHSHAMREASVSELAHRNALITTEALAAAALKLAAE
ncbi:MAG: amidohydrolase [Candidatus Limnocylindria bacterium]